MGSILLQAFCRQNVVKPENIVATVGTANAPAPLSSKFGVKVTTDNRAAVKDADIILLCIKPQTLGDVVREIEPELRDDQLIISIAASVPTAYIEQRIPGGDSGGPRHAQHALEGWRGHDGVLLRHRGEARRPRYRAPLCSTLSAKPSAWTKSTWTRSRDCRRADLRTSS